MIVTNIAIIVAITERYDTGETTVWIPGENFLMLNTDYIQKIDVDGLEIIATMHDGVAVKVGTVPTINALKGVMQWFRNQVGMKLFNDQSQTN